MSKLTREQAKRHDEAIALLRKDVLTSDEKEFIQDHWQESANHVNSAAGAFFTPPGLATDAMIECRYSNRVIDLCAGIGTLSLALWELNPEVELVCVELNPEYVEVGRKMVPHATWICGSIFDLPDLGRFEAAISNPPFGNIKRDGDGLNYTGSRFEYHTIALASAIADYGVFIIPQSSAGFSYSGRDRYERSETQKYKTFSKQTGIVLEAGCGVDTSQYEQSWHGVSPVVEIVTAEFERPAIEIPELALFDFDAA